MTYNWNNHAVRLDLEVLGELKIYHNTMSSYTTGVAI